MEFSDEENQWLEKISSEVPESDQLTQHEQLLHDLAKPQSMLEEIVFELMACIRFGTLTDPHPFGGGVMAPLKKEKISDHYLISDEFTW